MAAAAIVEPTTETKAPAPTLSARDRTRIEQLRTNAGELSKLYNRLNATFKEHELLTAQCKKLNCELAALNAKRHELTLEARAQQLVLLEAKIRLVESDTEAVLDENDKTDERRQREKERFITLAAQYRDEVLTERFVLQIATYSPALIRDLKPQQVFDIRDSLPGAYELTWWLFVPENGARKKRLIPHQKPASRQPTFRRS